MDVAFSVGETFHQLHDSITPSAVANKTPNTRPHPVDLWAVEGSCHCWWICIDVPVLPRAGDQGTDILDHGTHLSWQQLFSQILPVGCHTTIYCCIPPQLTFEPRLRSSIIRQTSYAEGLTEECQLELTLAAKPWNTCVRGSVFCVWAVGTSSAVSLCTCGYFTLRLKEIQCPCRACKSKTLLAN